MAVGPNVGKIYYNLQTLKLHEVTDGVTGAYRGYKSAMAAKQASNTIRRVHAAPPDAYDRIQHPHLNLSISRVPMAELVVAESIYRAANDHGWIVPVGRGLKCSSDIRAGTEIAVFKGVPITDEALADLPADQHGFVLDMSCSYSSATNLINCRVNSHGDRPECLASMANDPAGLYNRLQDVSLGPEDANAAVAIVMRKGNIEALLYATTDITHGAEVLWSYHAKDEPEAHHAEDSPLSSDTEETDKIRGAPIVPPLVTPIPYHNPPATTVEAEDIRGVEPGENPYAQPAEIRGVEQVRNDSGNTACIRGATQDTNSSDVIDDQATFDILPPTHLCVNHRHATDAWDPGTIAEPGMTGGIIEHYEESFFANTELGRVIYVPSGAASIISRATAIDNGATVTYNDQSDRFTITTTDGQTYTVCRATKGEGKMRSNSMDTANNPPATNTSVHASSQSTDTEISDVDLAMSFTVLNIRDTCLAHCVRKGL